jgi:hypothetical protein
MKLGPAIVVPIVFVSVVFVCSALTAQQTLLASSTLQPAGSLNSYGSQKASIVRPDRAFNPAIMSGLVNPLPLYVTLLQPAAAVCTAIPSSSAGPAESASYAFDHMQFSAAAIRAAFSHENMVKMAQNFRPGQPLPDAPSYAPLTTKQKFDSFLRNSHSASTGVGIVSDTLISQATGAYPKLGGGMGGFSQRLGISAAGAEGAVFFGGFLYPTLFHQDPRYFPSPDRGFLNRIAYAASRAFIGRSDYGMTVVNSSVIASQFTEAAIANAYIPYRHHSVGGTTENALIGIAGVAEGNILTEFWPDIKHFAWQHTHSKLLLKALELGDAPGQKAYK